MAAGDGACESGAAIGRRGYWRPVVGCRRTPVTHEVGKLIMMRDVYLAAKEGYLLMRFMAASLA